MYGVWFAVARWCERDILRLATPDQCFLPHSIQSVVGNAFVWLGEEGGGGERRHMAIGGV